MDLKSHMGNVGPIILFIPFLFISLSQFSCQYNREKNMAELNDLIEKNIEARGGHENLQAIRSLKITAKYIQPGRETPLTLTIKRPNLIFAEILYPSGPMICGYDGQTAWWFDPSRLAKPALLPAEEAIIFTRYADFGGLFMDHDQKRQEIELMGMEDVNGQKAHKLKIASRDGMIRHVYLDAKSFLDVKESFGSKKGKSFGLEVVYGDFRTVHGVTFPFHHDISREQTVIERIETNVDVDDSIFKIPEKPGTAKPLSVAGFVQKLQAYLETMAKTDLFSGVVLVARKGEPVFRKAYGMADRERNVPNQANTRFCIGSMNKMFTAVAIAQLVEQGKLSYDDLIGKYLGAEWILPAVGKKVKISHLLSHTSGIAEYLTDEFLASSAETYRTLGDYKPIVKEKSLTFEPGMRWEYCSTGYILLGAIIEKVSGRNYLDYVKECIYDPADMNDTLGFAPKKTLPNVAMGYDKVREAGKTFWKKTTFAGKINGSSAGGGFSTVDDMLKFAEALRSDRLIGRASKEILMSVKARSKSGDMEYGFGFIISFNGKLGRIVGHGGAAAGVSANFRMFVDKSCTMIVLSNYTDASLLASGYIRSLLPFAE